MSTKVDRVTQIPTSDPRTDRLTDAHQSHICRHLNDMEWETQRFESITSKMLFHPTPENPTEPNAGVLRYAPGGGHPLHNHSFAQVWYILSGDFKIGDKVYGPGTMVYHSDPHVEDELSTETGGDILFVQYQGPTTGKRPIYDGRFNLEKHADLEKEPFDY